MFQPMLLFGSIASWNLGVIPIGGYPRREDICDWSLSVSCHSIPEPGAENIFSVASIEQRIWSEKATKFYL